MKNKPVLIDTNGILRLIIGDKKDESEIMARLIENTDCIVSVEVIAEAVYNLLKKFEHTRQEIADEIKELASIKNGLVEDGNVVRFACNLYASSKLDFIDCILDAYAKVDGYQIFTFDGDLKKQLSTRAYIFQ